MNAILDQYAHGLERKVNGVENLDAFTDQKKQAFINGMRGNEFKLNFVCDKIGVNKQTVYKAMKQDEAFREAMYRTKSDVIDNTEQMLANCAQDEKRTVDRIFFLKAMKPEVYNPVQRFESTRQILFDVTNIPQFIQTKPIDVQPSRVLKEAREAELLPTSASAIMPKPHQNDASNQPAPVCPVDSTASDMVRTQVTKGGQGK